VVAERLPAIPMPVLCLAGTHGSAFGVAGIAAKFRSFSQPPEPVVLSTSSSRSHHNPQLNLLLVQLQPIHLQHLYIHLVGAAVRRPAYVTNGVPNFICAYPFSTNGRRVL
jgi:hypothetical protein